MWFVTLPLWKSSNSMLRGPKIDYIGTRHGHLTVAAFSHMAQTGAHWFCKCDCGETRINSSVTLRRGGAKSCGCQRPKGRPIVAGNANLSEDALWKRVLTSYKNNAKARSLNWAITDEEALNLFKFDCFYCRSGPSNEIKNAKKRSFSIFYNGIDRTDSDQGYILGNVVSCCVLCNFGKRHMKNDDFLRWIHRVARFTLEPIFDFCEVTPAERKSHPCIKDVAALYDIDLEEITPFKYHTRPAGRAELVSD